MCRRAEGSAGHAVDIVLPQLAMLPYIGRRGRAQLTIMKLSDNQLCSRRTVWQGQSTLPLPKRKLTRRLAS